MAIVTLTGGSALSLLPTLSATIWKRASMDNDDPLLHSIQEVIAESNLDPSLLQPEELAYIRAHLLNKPLRVIHIWSLGVGVVIAGIYFGWNFGLPGAGPIGILIPSLIVFARYLTCPLSLSELS